jgi:predicted signal transduction protein with EAL and GGDEF domain
MDLAPLLRRALERPARPAVAPPTWQPSGSEWLALMQTATQLPADEAARLSTLHELNVLDMAPDPELLALVQLAAQLCDAPMAALSFVDSTCQRYAARVGFSADAVERAQGLCGRAILWPDRALQIDDTTLLPWFDPFLHGGAAPPVRFYAGVPLRTGDGSAVGTLCVMDKQPRTLTDAQRQQLETVARTVCTQLRLRRELRIATRTDRLTGLPNWLHFEGQFEAARPAKGVVCFVRMRALSQINSAHGFRVADGLLTQAAVRLRGLAEGHAFIGRIKRGLFLLFYPEIDANTFSREQALALSTQLQVPYHVGGLTLVCPVHLGFAAFPEDGRTLDDVVNAADAALQLAIERDEPAAFFDKSVDAAASAHYRLEPQLRLALERNEFVNFYQPKVDLATRRIVGVEALIRWVHPDRGLVPPSEFVPAMEATGLIREVGRHIMLRAVADWQRWQSAGLHAPRIAVNVAAAQLRHGELVRHLGEALSAIDGNAAALSVEVTESVLIGNMEQAIDVLAQVRALGVPVAIDDFGTGYSSLAYIVTLPIDEVKIDRSFIRKIAVEPAYRGIVGTCVHLARNLGLKVVAEGVETRDQARELLALQCDQAQGFLYSEPIPADQLALLLRRGGPLA